MSTWRSIFFFRRRAGTGSGESNTASNPAATGIGWFLSKVGVDLRFKSIYTDDPAIDLTDNPTQSRIEIAIDRDQLVNQTNDTLTASQTKDIDSIPLAGIKAVKYLVYLNVTGKNDIVELLGVNETSDIRYQIVGLFKTINYDLSMLVSGGNAILRLTNNEASSLDVRFVRTLIS